VWGGKTPDAFVLRYQRFSSRDDPSEDAPLRSAAGWANVELTVLGDQTRFEVNGLGRTDAAAPLEDGKIALPSDLAVQYRNIVLIPFLP
jgi:hypothetical protein